MKIHQVSYTDDMNGHEGYSYHGTKKEAVEAAGEFIDNGNGHAKVKTYTFAVTPRGMLRALNRLASHNDNG